MTEPSKSCHFNRSNSAVWLVDNGSLRAQSVLALRVQAARLAEMAGIAVEPVSVLHSAKVPPEQLGGHPALSFTPHLRASAAAGLRRLLVVPYFFGASAALTEYLPQQIARVQQEFPQLQVRIAPPLVDLAAQQDDAPQVLASLLAKEIIGLLDDADAQSRNPSAPSSASATTSAFAASARPLPAVVLVDHGSPQPAVSAVRDRVGEILGHMLTGRVAAFGVCSMEAREGAEYAHTLPLLEQVLRQEPFCNGRVIIAPLFLGPGRHAGEGGDLWQIAEGVRAVHPLLDAVFCPLLGGNPQVTQLLLRRLRLGEQWLADASLGNRA